ncbi:MAG: hypothetical protein JNL79_35250 [Myxococcales bacterium]|nr:hypothetical protein [Myxococcales bacterium]
MRRSSDSNGKFSAFCAPNAHRLQPRAGCARKTHAGYERVEDILRDADTATAQGDGRGRYDVFTDDLRESDRRAAVPRRLRHRVLVAELLTRMPIHALKVDRSFVARLTEDSMCASIVQTILTLAAALGTEANVRSTHPEPSRSCAGDRADLADERNRRCRVTTPKSSPRRFALSDRTIRIHAGRRGHVRRRESAL